MAEILDIQTVGSVLILTCDVNPALGLGTIAPLGSFAMTQDGSGTFYKGFASNTAWYKLSQENEMPVWGENKQYLLVENFDKGALPQGFGSSVASGGAIVFTQVSESGVSPGMALITTTAAINSRSGIIGGNGFQYMRNFTDAVKTELYIQVRWNGVPSPTNAAHIFGWINQAASANPTALGNCLGIMYDPTNVSGFNPGLITNLFLLARANYTSPTANTIVDLGILPDPVNWSFYKITYNTASASVTVFKNGLLLTTLSNLANVPAGAIRGVIPAVASGGLQPGVYIGSSSAVAPATATGIRLGKLSVFKQFSV